jgi:hypothetical protein
MLRRFYTQLTPLQHLTTVTLVMFAAGALTYLIPQMGGLRPWIPGEEGFPIVRLFGRWGEIPAFAGDGGAYRGSTATQSGAERLAETVGKTVAANLGTRPVIAPRVRPEDRLRIDPSEYAGISARIEDPTGLGMRAFYQALEKTARGDKGAVTRAGHYGDSSIATDLITSTVGRCRRLDRSWIRLAAKLHHASTRRAASLNAEDWEIPEVVRRQDRRELRLR